MTSEKQSPRSALRPAMLQVPIVLLGLAALIAVAAEVVGLGLGLAVFGVAILAAIATSALSMRSFECPDCSARLEAPSGWWFRFPGAKILLRCASCDIDWDYGVTGADD